MIEIRPHDVLFFRESRDFTAGQAHVGRSVEPLPHTLAGAIMGALFARRAYDLLNLEVGNGVKKKPSNGEWRPGFSIEGVFFHDGSSPLFKMPMDIVETELGIGELKPYWPLKKEEPAVHASVQGKRTLRFSPLEGFVGKEFLMGYLRGEPALEDLDLLRPYLKEERVGIALNGLKTTVVGMFYRTEFLRLDEKSDKRVRIAVYLSESDEEKLKAVLGEEGVLKLGGESRFARFEFKDGELPIPEALEVPAGGTVRVYLATPVVGKFEDIKTTLIKKLGNVEFLKLFTGRRLKVTGWDMVERKPKPLKYALPAGTVFWFRVKESLSLPGKMSVGEMTWAGYGLAFTGVLG